MIIFINITCPDKVHNSLSMSLSILALNVTGGIAI